jgi:hypothetical protein
MNIPHTESNIRAATSILENLRGDDDAVLPTNAIVTWDGEELRLTSDLIPLFEDEEIVFNGLDRFGDGGDGWEEEGALELVLEFITFAINGELD